MIRASAYLLITLLLGCTLPTATGPRLPALRNDCLPQAVAMVEGLAKYRIPAKVLIMRPASPETMGHAVSVYLYRGRLWVWDAYWGSVASLATPWDALGIGWDWWARYGLRGEMRGAFQEAHWYE